MHAIRALIGKPPEQFTPGVSGFAAALRATGSDYVRSNAEAIFAMLQAVTLFVFAPVIDLVQLARGRETSR